MTFSEAPYLLFSILSFIVSILVMKLPETKNRNLPDTLDEMARLIRWVLSIHIDVCMVYRTTSCSNVFIVVSFILVINHQKPGRLLRGVSCRNNTIWRKRKTQAKSSNHEFKYIGGDKGIRTKMIRRVWGQHFRLSVKLCYGEQRSVRSELSEEMYEKNNGSVGYHTTSAFIHGPTSLIFWVVRRGVPGPSLVPTRSVCTVQTPGIRS